MKILGISGGSKNGNNDATVSYTHLSSSKAAMFFDSAGCEMYSFSAALVKFRHFAASMKHWDFISINIIPPLCRFRN